MKVGRELGSVLSPRILRWAEANGYGKEVAATREMLAEFKRLFPPSGTGRATMMARMKRAEERAAKYRAVLAL